ncbi:MAG TPA: serine hydrolase [Bacteroidota bacterium]
MAFEDYIEKEILKPLGMEASSFLMKQWETGRIAAPYSVDSVYEISPRKTYPYNRAYAPSSTMHSRAYEMCLYALAHLNHGQLNGTRILDESAYAHMWTPTSSEISHMGLGWFLGDHRGYKTVSHSGGDPGFSTNLVLIPDERTAVIVLSNYDRASVIPLSDALVDIALGLEPEPLTVRKEELDRAIYKALATGGSEAARTKFQELKSTQPNFDFTQVRQLMSLSSNLKHAGRAADAIVVDELNIMTFRPFAFLYNNLAETCLLAGDTTKALANFEKVLELSPQHSNAQKRVQQLKN